MKSSIHISKGGKRIHFKGPVANQVFNEMAAALNRRKISGSLSKPGNVLFADTQFQKKSDICGECACEDDGI